MTFVTVRPAVHRRPALNMDRWLDELFNIETPKNGRLHTNGLAHPPVNVLEREDAFHIQLAVPGMDKSDFELKVDKDVLTISGKREANAIDGETFRRREFGNFTFERRFQLPDTVDAGAIAANYTNGILDITAPKKAEKPAKKIVVA